MALRILIVDDDEVAGNLSRELLAEAGAQAELLTDSTLALAALRRREFDLVLLDILMPGVDGLTLCHQIKSDPAYKSLKVVMVSGKAFSRERERARSYGADLFIDKPYDTETFAEKVFEVGRRAASAAWTAPPPDMLGSPDPKLDIRVWGSRNGPSPDSKAPSRYGFDTPCVTVEADGKLLIFDAGSGLAKVDEAALAGRREAWIFLTGFSPSHTEGLGRFRLSAREDALLHVAAVKDPGETLEAHLQEVFDRPGAGDPVRAEVELYEILEESYEVLPGVRLTTFYANHPGTTAGFVLEARGRTFAYCPSSEIHGEATTALQDYDEKLGRLASGADLLIHDGRFTPEDYRTMRGHGHSNAMDVVDFAGKAEAQRLLLFGLDERYTDSDLDNLGSAAARQAAAKGYPTQVAVARDGLKLGI